MSGKGRKQMRSPHSREAAWQRDQLATARATIAATPLGNTTGENATGSVERAAPPEAGLQAADALIGMLGGSDAPQLLRRGNSRDTASQL